MLLIMTTCNWLSSCDHHPLSPLNAKKEAQPLPLSLFLRVLRLISFSSRNSLPPNPTPFLPPQQQPNNRHITTTTFLFLSPSQLPLSFLSYPSSFEPTLSLLSVPTPRTRTSLSLSLTHTSLIRLTLSANLHENKANKKNKRATRNATTMSEKQQQPYSIVKPVGFTIASCGYCHSDNSAHVYGAFAYKLTCQVLCYTS